MHQVDTSSIRGTLITLGASAFSFSTINPLLQFLSLCLAIGVGIQTYLINRKKLKKQKR